MRHSVRQQRSVHVRRNSKRFLCLSSPSFVSHSQASPSRSPVLKFVSPTSRIPPRRSVFTPWAAFFPTFTERVLFCAFLMATRNMHSHFPKRKSSATAVTSSKGLSAASYKSRDPVYGAFDDIGSGGGTVGAGDSQPAALISSGRKDLNEEYDDVEEILRQFDMNMAYGPCLGVSRLERFERARRFGLNPPLHVKNLLERVGGNPDALWEGRV